ncbi:MAG TPA: pyridoxal phosphate-dependent aminotransferase [Bryobacteraceae bacterium]|nr:pyridoxal phosphate-dependent aminotransferase [Bryobacteraceae bacterium]
MFSSRLDWNLATNPITRLLEEKRAAGVRIFDLTESNPTAAGFAYPTETILAALADPKALRYEPAPAGLPAARTAVASYYSGRVDPERILLTSSTSDAYAFLFKLLCDPGSEVLTPRPSYPLFEFLAALESVRPVQYPLAYDGSWHIDFDALRRLIAPRTRAVVLVNPNNPTGSFVKQGELAQLIELCRDHGMAIISDEVFSDYAIGDDTLRVRSLVDVREVLTFSLSGLSKIAGLPQMKLGWIVASGPERERGEALHRLELIADTYLSVGTPVQCAAAALLEARHGIQEQIRSRVRGNLEFLRSQIGAGSPWRELNLEGGWYATLQAPRIRTEEEWALVLLAEDNVLVQPGFYFDFASEAFLVVSMLTPADAFREGVRRILARAS